MFPAITDFKIKCLREIESGISLPEKGWAVINHDNFRLCCFIKKMIKYIYVPSRLHGAMFLKKHGIISDYAVKGEDVLMFTKTPTAVAGKRGELVWMDRLVPFKWEDISFTPCQVISYFAISELESGIKGKVLDMTNFLIRA